MMQVEVEIRFPWVRMTPLGTPVLPLVYMMMAVSEGSGGASAWVEDEPEERTEENLWKLIVSVLAGIGSPLWLGMTTTFLTEGALGRTAKSRGSSSSSTITVLASV